SFMISQITPAGVSPERRDKSTAASVCPRRSSTPPGRARRGKTCPGRARSSGQQFLSMAILIVCARSLAEIPVVTPCPLASIETVKAVLCRAAPDRPNEYLGRFYQLLEKDSANWISRAVRQVQAFEKRGVIIHYVVIFTVLGGLPLLFWLATLGSHLTW